MIRFDNRIFRKMLRNDMFSLVLFLIIVCNGKEIPKNDAVEGYHWRDYAGFIPHDAFPGGKEKGDVTYIGQVLHNDILLPAKIVQAEKKAYFEWEFKEHIATENIKILCTDNPKKLKWLSTSSASFKNITAKRLINGGYETGTKTYIGRMNKAGEKLLGKLQVTETAILYTTQNGKSVESQEFEVLSFINQEEEAVISSEGFYWRDYVGVIPHDAFPAGIEGDHTTYIALVLFDKLLVPGKIIANEKKAHFEWGLSAHTAYKDIKIFCTDRPESFHWFSTNSKDFRNIKDKHFVVGSHEDNGILYIGRMHAGADLIVGKLLVNDKVFLHSVQGDRPIQNRVFDVLYYDPPSD